MAKQMRATKRFNGPEGKPENGRWVEKGDTFETNRADYLQNVLQVAEPISTTSKASGTKATKAPAKAKEDSQ